MKNAKTIPSSDAVAVLVSATGLRDVVQPIIGDKLIPVGLAHRELAGGELDRRILDLIERNYLVLGLDEFRVHGRNSRYRPDRVRRPRRHRCVFQGPGSHGYSAGQDHGR